MSCRSLPGGEKIMCLMLVGAECESGVTPWVLREHRIQQLLIAQRGVKSWAKRRVGVCYANEEESGILAEGWAYAKM